MSAAPVHAATSRLAGDDTEPYQADSSNFRPMPQAGLCERFRVLDSGRMARRARRWFETNRFRPTHGTFDRLAGFRNAN